MQRLKEACRNAVKDDTDGWRLSKHPADHKCEWCGETECVEVDHCGAMSFHFIFTRWIKSHVDIGADPLCFPLIHTTRGFIFRMKTHLTSFRTLHNSKAQYRFLCRTCNSMNNGSFDGGRLLTTLQAKGVDDEKERTRLLLVLRSRWRRDAALEDEPPAGSPPALVTWYAERFVPMRRLQGRGIQADSHTLYVDEGQTSKDAYHIHVAAEEHVYDPPPKAAKVPKSRAVKRARPQMLIDLSADTVTITPYKQCRTDSGGCVSCPPREQVQGRPLESQSPYGASGDGPEAAVGS